MADPMKIRATVVGDATEVKVLMSHEMETGQRKDAQGAVIPAWFIQNVTATHGGKTVLAAQWGPAVSKNPFLSFKFKGGAKGDKVHDHLGRQPRRQAHRRSDHRVACGRSQPLRRVRHKPDRVGALGIARRIAVRCSLDAALPPQSAWPWRLAQAQTRPSTASPSTARRCRTAIPPSCGRRAAKGLWKEPRGPKKVSLERCDLGLGPASSRAPTRSLPKYFADADRVMDLETRLVWCMVKLQGYAEADAKKNPFGNGNDKKSDIEALVAYITCESRGVKMNVSLAHPKEIEMYRVGEKMFYFRGGPHDFGCVTCHGDDGKRIRLQDLPNLTKIEGAQKAYTTWPAYRVSQGELRTFQWRLNDCFRQQRFPELEFGSDASIALTMFLARNANGAAFDAPAIKR